MNTDSDMLLEQIKKGDLQAYNDLFSRHRKMLKRAIRLRIDPLLKFVSGAQSLRLQLKEKSR